MEQKNMIKDVVGAFKKEGGQFCSPAEKISNILAGVRAFIFDWDGVFHNGSKFEGYHGAFSEIDSMGINLLRYGIWQNTNTIPQVAIITGQNNPTAIKLAEREHFNAVYQNVIDKKKAIEHLSVSANLDSEQIATVFDDVNDLAMSRLSGLRVLVKRGASPLLMRYLIDNRLIDYVTGNGPNHYAIREISELFLGLLGKYDDVVMSRVSFDENYQRYWKARNEIGLEKIVL